MASSDELKRRQRVISHQFIDFLEALARISDLLSLPEEDEIMAWLKNNIPQDEHCDYPYWTYNKHIARTVCSAQPLLPLAFQLKH